MRLGTRGSALAMWQAREVARLLLERTGIACEIVVIRTSGDEPPGPPHAPGTIAAGTSGDVADGTRGASRARGTSGTRDPVKTQFVKEIEEALLDGRVDLAVHSSKDLPAMIPEGLALAAALPREDPRDALLLPASRRIAGIDELRAVLGESPRVGTSSVRRMAQISALVPGARFVAIRGNVDTRVRKLDAGNCDAIVLAAAGLNRLGRADRISWLLPEDLCVPAPGQGIVAIEVRSNDTPTMAAVSAIGDAQAMDALRAERAVVFGLGGGCQMPLGALARHEGDDLVMHAVVFGSHSRALRATARGHRSDPERVGLELVQTLLNQGAATALGLADVTAGVDSAAIETIHSERDAAADADDAARRGRQPDGPDE